LHNFFDISTTTLIVAGVFFLTIQKLNLLLTHERIDDTFARRDREYKKEAKERAQYFKDLGCKDLSLEK
jgi:hypothetical protein